MLGIQGREQRTERNIYINNNKNIKLRQSVEGRTAMREVVGSVSGRFARRSIRPMAVRPHWVDSPDVYL